MTQIKVMDQLLANKIAAGEVVEKCASVVKELVENAIDAGSDEIKINLKDAGIKEIKVIDNGEGMAREDAKLAFARHATSKVLDENDLYHINTLGFRGEALASIASVSKVEMITAAGDVGTRIVIKGGQEEIIEDASSRRGCMVVVSDLFYNTPARLKYLKNLYTELANIINLINKMALANPHIKFELTNNNKSILKTDGSNDLLKVIMAVYGQEVAQNMLELNIEDEDYLVWGYVGKPIITRSNRNHMTTIVNGRVVRNNELNKIINEAYYTYKPDNQYPIIILNIKVDASLIDVNIHPMKHDIKFSKFGELKKLLKAEIEKVLAKKEFIPKAKSKYQQESFSFVVSEDDAGDDLIENKVVVEKDKNEAENLPYLEPVALLFGTYIIAQNEQGMYLIDQHAANERINYEQIKAGLENNKTEKIALFAPIVLEFTGDEFIILKENLDILHNMGFLVEEFGGNAFIIKEHPTWLPKGYEKDRITKLMALLITKEKEFDLHKFNEKVAINLSCKISIKANEYITKEEMMQLIDDLRNCQNPYTCPHGRPTIISYTKYELEKMFKRSG